MSCATLDPGSGIVGAQLMDVRCEKCLTVYDFDDAQVGPQGSTVKCTQCGNLFKVKRREAEAPVPQPVGAVTMRAKVNGLTGSGSGPVAVPAPTPPATTPQWA